MSEERKRFEKWIPTTPFERASEVQLAWEAWQAAKEWRDIALAPKDKLVLLTWWNELLKEWRYEVDFAYCTRGGWMHGQATHFQPLPEPPEGR